MHYRFISTFVWLCACSGLLAASLSGCRNNPGRQDDVVVTAPGVVAKSDDQGVSVKAPLGVEVSVGDKGVTVKAPFVDVKTDSQGTRVNAAGVNVTADDKGVAVDAPLVTVRTGAQDQNAAKAP